MEKRFYILWLCLLPLGLLGQDQMHLTDGRILDVRVTQIDRLYLFYYMSNRPDGPEYSIPKLQVERLVYEDGAVEVLGATQTTTTRGAVAARRAPAPKAAAPAPVPVPAKKADTDFGVGRDLNQITLVDGQVIAGTVLEITVSEVFFESKGRPQTIGLTEVHKVVYEDGYVEYFAEMEAPRATPGASPPPPRAPATSRPSRQSKKPATSPARSSAKAPAAAGERSPLNFQFLAGPTLGFGLGPARQAATPQLEDDGAAYAASPGYTQSLSLQPAVGWHLGARVVYRFLPKLGFVAGLHATTKHMNIRQDYTYIWQTSDGAIAEVEITEQQRTLHVDIPLGLEFSILDSWGVMVGGHLATGLQGRSDLATMARFFDAEGELVADEGIIEDQALLFPGPANTAGIWAEANTLLLPSLGLRFRLAHDLGGAYARAYPNTRFQLSLFWQISP